MARGGGADTAVGAVLLRGRAQRRRASTARAPTSCSATSRPGSTILAEHREEPVRGVPVDRPDLPRRRAEPGRADQVRHHHRAVRGVRTHVTVPCPAADGSSEKRQKFDERPRCASTRPSATPPRWSPASARMTDRPRPGRRAEDGQQLRLPGPLPLLRRRHLPPDHPGLHVPGRRPDGHRAGRSRATSSPTSCPSRGATRSARSPWPTPARTPTAASSSS